jgi:hypothetical protein
MQTLISRTSKVPAVILSFWVIKVAATTLGETGGDTLSMTFKLGYALSTLIFAVLFIAYQAACAWRAGYQSTRSLACHCGLYGSGDFDDAATCRRAPRRHRRLEAVSTAILATVHGRFAVVLCS